MSLSGTDGCQHAGPTNSIPESQPSGQQTQTDSRSRHTIKRSFRPPDQVSSTPYLPSPVSPFHGEPLHLTVNALPPLKVVQLLGNACLSPTTLAPKGPFRPRGPKWILWFSLDSVEPHRVTSNDLVGALGAIPAAWWRTSHDVLARLMFSSRADSFSPANRLHPHYQRANSIVPGAGSRSRIVYNNHHSFTYAASVA